MHGSTPTPTTTGSRVARWRLFEPVRFYCWFVVALVLAVLAVPAAVLGEWLGLEGAAVGAVLVAWLGGEHARRSVYSAPGVIEEIRQMRAGQ